jgi:serine/threonine-protein kinase
MQTLAPGAIVDRKYKIEKVLGEGGMGVVWLGRDVVTDVPVVLKAIRAEFTHLKDFRDRILAEGRALARIDHPNVVRLNAVICEENEVCLVMQFIEGESLDARIERNLEQKTQFSLAEALTIFRQIVSGVAAAHAEGIIHRDLKPANVLVRAKDGVVKVTDFGIAKDESEAQSGQGKTVGVIGSVRYMAPEQCKGQKDLDKRADVYALGILLFELLTGQRPFQGGSNFELMSQHVHEPLPSLRALRPDVPDWLEHLVRKCAQKQRENRYSSCEELLADIPADLNARPSSTVPAMPVMNPAPSSTVPGLPVTTGVQAMTGMPGMTVMPAMMDGPRPAMSSNVTAPASAVTASNTAPVTPNRAPMVLGTVVISVAMGLGLSYSLGWFGKAEQASNGPSKPAEPAQQPAMNPDRPGSPTVKPKNALEALQGAWKSSSGREYDAVVVGDVLEMRIHDEKPFLIQGYERNEARFVLRAAPGKTDTFLVEDRLRPNAPAGKEYDPARARLTCLVPFTEIDGKPLEARLENGKLHVSMVVIKPETSHYTFDGKYVTGCRNLLTAGVSPIESVLGRP